MIRVKDNDSGIHPEDLPYGFDRFYRAEPSRNSNWGNIGLGLAIAKAQVFAQGGSVHVESTNEDSGTTFVLRFSPYSAPPEGYLRYEA